jgi:hypothetical protein
MNSGTAWTIADGGVLRKEEVDAEAHKADDPPKRVRVPSETEEKIRRSNEEETQGRGEEEKDPQGPPDDRHGQDRGRH